MRIVVTGGAQGIGRAIIELLLEKPSNSIIIIDKQTTAFIDDCASQYPDRVRFYLQDIAEAEGLTRVLAEIGASPLDAIVNNAGEVYLEKWDDLQMAIWSRTMAVNVTAPLQIAHQLRGSLAAVASIVNITSTDGYKAAFDTIAYAASKAALINLTQSLAVTLGAQGVRVNAVAPGWVETEMTKDTLPAEAKQMTPLGRNATARDVAECVGFLLSAKASFINGETITVDGGLGIVDYTLKKESEAN